MSIRLDETIVQIRQNIKLSSEIIDNNFKNLIDFFKDHDNKTRKKIQKRDKKIDQLENEINNLCLNCIALQQPVAKDLRLLFSAILVNVYLERIGDLIKGSAKRIDVIDESFSKFDVKSFNEMFDLTKKQFDLALKSYLNEAVEFAQDVIKSDKAINDLNKNILKKLLKDAESGVIDIKDAFELSDLSKNLEAIGDICKNIATQTFFVVEAKVYKHHESDIK